MKNKEIELLKLELEEIQKEKEGSFALSVRLRRRDPT